MKAINIKTLREARCFVYILKELDYRKSDSIRCDTTDIKSINSAINNHFESIKHEREKHDQYSMILFNGVNELLTQRMVSNDELIKISYNERICYYSFIFLEQKNRERIHNNNHLEKIIPTSKKEILKYIENTFDYSIKPKEEKIETINEIVKSYKSSTANFQKTFQWIDKRNKEQCDWAYDYTCRKFKNEIKPITFTHHDNPQTSEEKYFFIVGTFDFLEHKSPTEKSEYMNSMRKAWDQKTYREKSKNKNKTCINFYIKETTKQKLEEITKNRKIKTSTLIEEMIEKEYNEL